MKKISDLRKFHEQLNDAFYELEKEEEFPNHFYQSFLSGENTLTQKSVSETKTFHEDWIGTIESYFPSLDKITKDPKSGLKYLQEVTAIEKAKKTNSDSIRHLAANTHLIKEIREGQVVPKKILTTQAEIQYAIYENRFIKTLVERLYDFVSRRYKLIKENVDSYQDKLFSLNSKFNIRNTEIQMDIDLKIREDLGDESVNRYNYDLLNRVQNLLKKVNGIKVSPFMEEIKNAKPVVAPIMKTQIILKNIDYRNCYNLWLFLDKYNILSFDVDVKEQNLTFDKYYLKNIYQTALTTFTTVYGNQKALEDHYQYLDVMEYQRKSPKFARKSLRDIIKNPDPMVIEDNLMNQYFLDQNKELFKEKLNQNVDDSSTYEIGLRKAIRDTLAITNTLFEDYFDFNEKENDEDMFFSRMVKTDLESEHLKAKDKARVAKIVREVKEVDYNNAIRLEKRMLKEIEYYDKQISKELKRKSITESKKQAIEEKIKLERKNLDKNQKILTEYLEFVSAQKEVLIEEHRAAQEKLRLEAKRLKEEEIALIELEKKKVRDKYNQEMKKLKEKQRLQKQKVVVQARKDKQEEKRKLSEEQRKLAKASQTRIRKEKAKIEKQMKEKIRKEKTNKEK